MAKKVFDCLFCDTLDFRVPVSNLSKGNMGNNMEEVAKQLCAEVGLELMDYGSYMRIPVGETMEIRFRGDRWSKNQQR